MPEPDPAVAAVDDLSDAVETQSQTEREALENTANNPITAEVEAAVKALLGLES